MPVSSPFRAAATGPGNAVVYVGAKTGRDGIHGATMASTGFGGADAGDDAGDEVPGTRMARTAEAQRIEDRYRSRPHREHVAQNTADPSRRTLIGLDEGRVVVALDLEYDRVAVADVDNAGVLARAADDARPRGRQGLEPDLR